MRVLYVLIALLATVALLIATNEFLHGAKKRHIDAFLSLAVFILLTVGFLFEGWKAALLLLALVFILTRAFRPAGARLAARLLSIGQGERGHYIGLPPSELRRICQVLGRSLSPRQMVKELMSDNRQRAEEALLDYCESNPQIRTTMDKLGVDREGLRERYRTLILAGAGQWAGGHFVAASSIAYPHTLRYLLRQPVEGRESILGTAHALVVHFERGVLLPKASTGEPA